MVSGPAHSPLSWGAPVFPLEVLEDRHFELGFLAAAVPHLCAVLLAPEGDLDALDIPIPYTHVEAVSGPYAPFKIASEEAKMASYRFAGTYVDTVPPPGTNVVSGMWLHKMKQPPGEPPVFKACSARLRVALLGLLHSVPTGEPALADLAVSLLGFTGSFPPGTQWQLRRPVYGLRHAPHEWHDMLRTTLLVLEFFLLSADLSLFVRRGSTPFFVLVYVDDLVFITPDRRAVAYVKEDLQRRHTCKNLGELQRYLGLQITRDNAARTITLTHMTPCADLLTELEPSVVKHVISALGQRAKVKCMGKAMFKGADGKMVDLKNVLWVPKLAANLISVRRLQKAGMDTSSKGAKTYAARLGERILLDLHEDRDVYNEMQQILVVPMPKERQVAASISTNGTSKLGEHDESGAAAQKQHKGKENPKASAEEDYGESMSGTVASVAFSNPTSAMGECDWLILHPRMGHMALPILQQLVKNEIVSSIRVKGEPDEVLGCTTCMEAKFTCYPFSGSEAMAKAPLDEVVMEVVGPLNLGAAGAEYFLAKVDVYTRMTWVYMLSKKSDVAETVKTDWLPMVERQQDWLALPHQYSPAMNGIAERANRTITETAHGLLIEAGLPDYFWPDAVRSTCVAKSRALTHVGAEKWVPYVEWIGRKPKVDMLRVFGCMCMALVP
ncbi:unnamed protein product [Closterium sp. NIES-54]